MNVLKVTELKQLAQLTCEAVNQVDLYEPGDKQGAQESLRTLLGELTSRYQNNELLFDFNSALLGKPFSKMSFYTAARDLLKQVRAVTESRIPMADPQVVTMVEPIVQPSTTVSAPAFV